MTRFLIHSSVGIAILLFAGCHDVGGNQSVAANADTSQPIILAPGQELDLTLGTVGPGEYQGPPAISSSAVLFLAEEPGACPCTPAGATQLFRFKGETPGEAIITIQHSGSVRPGGDLPAIDTVEVR